ncbi:hypothetical protein LIN78_11990 [Leeia sp. TBRC 13508]|uniref:Toprim domain-containing protein n=1 Tax=Leeia speluncae TaxID=2884804 RepID=A0ABS8D7T0_9NEIS|nr:hypothetical protein [Leeia speluncae]MCB6184265.1 hypothetical protein [Leeia speluncae]
MNELAIASQFEARGCPAPSLPLRFGRKVTFGPKKKAWYRLREFISATGERIIHGWGGYKAAWWPIEPDSEKLSEDDLNRFRQEREAIEKAERERAVRDALAAASRAENQFRRAETGTASQHPYVIEKQIKPAAVRVITDDSQKGWLIIPLRRFGSLRLVGSQKISPEAGFEKLYNKGMAKQGSCVVIGSSLLQGTTPDLIAVCEGWATGCSLAEAMDWSVPVVVAMDAANLLAVARDIRAVFPNVPVLFGADDDYLTDHDGALSARFAASKIGKAYTFMPKFSVPRAAAKEGDVLPRLTDFNDLHVAEGIETVRSQCRDAIRFIHNLFRK